jgi:ribulose-5-phosphate 4-epimerase/fuculose-1-phosphate aldolase
MAVPVDLAAGYRLCDLYGMSDLIYTHISARVPGEPDHFLPNPHGTLFDEVTASSLFKVDLDGKVQYRPKANMGFIRPATSFTARSIARGPPSTPPCTPTPSPGWRCRR